ncbi:hypothetical protein HNQ99_002709 [Rhizorhapis suberifaciens]|uniref:Uncharacterized protein n=1 Tax=Rhizorhapis suberifaciens TaxID=13656 RepID=A0A840HYC1_9SPHN|nr:hypothetical protein [Rhizorhapis suberifaciens]
MKRLILIACIALLGTVVFEVGMDFGRGRIW